MNIWIISDTHWNHDKMMEYENRPSNHTEQILENWRKVVRYNDLVIHLGDVIFGQETATKLPNILASLPGKKILCRGNHDREQARWYMEHGFDFACDYFVYDIYAFSHCPLTPLPRQEEQRGEIACNFHGHFHRKPAGEGDKYNFAYYKTHKDQYHLIQIEDELRPFSLEEVIDSWLNK